MSYIIVLMSANRLKNDCSYDVIFFETTKLKLDLKLVLILFLGL